MSLALSLSVSLSVCLSLSLCVCLRCASFNPVAPIFGSVLLDVVSGGWFIEVMERDFYRKKASKMELRRLLGRGVAREGAGGRRWSSRRRTIATTSIGG